VFTLFNDDVIVDGSVVSSTIVPLKQLIPKVGIDMVESIKEKLVSEMIVEAKQDPSKTLDVTKTKFSNEINREISNTVKNDYKWEGPLKMNVKPKVENKNS